MAIHCEAHCVGRGLGRDVPPPFHPALPQIVKIPRHLEFALLQGQGLGFKVQGSRSRVQDLKFKDFGFRG
jgi:hypothetical protein